MRRRQVLWVSGCLALAAVAGCKPAGEARPERRQGPPEQYIRASLGAGESAKATMGLIAIRKAIQMYQVQNSRVPASLEQLHQEGFLPEVPPAPVGKRFAYDPAAGTVSVVDK